MNPLSLELTKQNLGYQLKLKYQTTHYLTFMYDLKLYSKDVTQMSSLVNTVHSFGTDIRIEFRLKTCGILYMKLGKVNSLSGI